MVVHQFLSHDGLEALMTEKVGADNPHGNLEAI
jgi:hypothetical protein